MVSDLLTFGHWKVVFSLFLILHRAFSHFMYLTFCQFCKRKMVQSSFQKLFLNLDCDVVSNLVVEIEIFNFFLLVCLHVCLCLTFCQFAKGKWSNHDSKNCSEIKTVTWSVIWLWKLKFSIFVCLFVYLFVCTSRFGNFARGKWSNHNSKNCSEIRAVTPF